MAVVALLVGELGEREQIVERIRVCPGGNNLVPQKRGEVKIEVDLIH